MAEGKIGDQNINFINEFAAARLNANGSILSTETFGSVDALNSALAADASLKKGGQ